MFDIHNLTSQMYKYDTLVFKFLFYFRICVFFKFDDVGMLPSNFDTIDIL